MKELMPKSYFDEVTREMVKAGFVLISVVPIDNTEIGYHVPVTVARATSMFFHMRGKSLIIMLRYIEDDCYSQGEILGYWDVSIFIRFKSYMTLLAENPSWLGDSLEDTLYGDMPILGNQDLTIEGFRSGTGLGLFRNTKNEQVGVSFYEERGCNDSPLSPTVLAHEMKKVATTLENYLDKEPFRELCLLHFYPYYSFNDGGRIQGLRSDEESERLQQIFWPKFDWSYFRHLVIRPCGYNFRKKPVVA